MTTENSTDPMAGYEVADAFYGSDSNKTKKLMRELERRGPQGLLAASLFRAQKASTRAKDYPGPFRDYAYADKNEHIATLCELLDQNEYSWGWGIDRRCHFPDVLYIDLPTGQVSFHAVERLWGDDYPGEWDMTQSSEKNVIEFAQQVLDMVPPSDAPKKAKPQKPKTAFRCACCDTEKLSSQTKPNGWKVLFHADEEHLVCSDDCLASLRDRLDKLVFDESWTFPRGEHEGKRLRDVPERYLRWLYRNLESKRWLFWQAARAELRRRYPDAICPLE